MANNLIFFNDDQKRNYDDIYDIESSFVEMDDSYLSIEEQGFMKGYLAA